jgi:hypothetical protein
VVTPENVLRYQQHGRNNRTGYEPIEYDYFFHNDLS